MEEESELNYPGFPQEQYLGQEAALELVYLKKITALYFIDLILFFYVTTNFLGEMESSVHLWAVHHPLFTARREQTRSKAEGSIPRHSGGFHRL